MNPKSVIILSLLIAQLVVTGCSSRKTQPANNKTTQTPVPASTIAICAERMNMTFPADMKVTNVWADEEWMDRATALKAKLPRDSVARLLKDSPFGVAELRSDRRYPPAMLDLPWWNIEKPKVFQSGEVMLPGPCFLSVLIDLDDPAIATVYLFWNET